MLKNNLTEPSTLYFCPGNSQRAKTYRKLNHIPDNWGTAVNVQAMVFGNMGTDCSTGVAFTEILQQVKKLFLGNI